jgi:hypothetical protein
MKKKNVIIVTLLVAILSFISAGAKEEEKDTKKEKPSSRPLELSWTNTAASSSLWSLVWETNEVPQDIEKIIGTNTDGNVSVSLFRRGPTKTNVVAISFYRKSKSCTWVVDDGSIRGNEGKALTVVGVFEEQLFGKEGFLSSTSQVHASVTMQKVSGFPASTNLPTFLGLLFKAGINELSGDAAPLNQTDGTTDTIKLKQASSSTTNYGGAPAKFAVNWTWTSNSPKNEVVGKLTDTFNAHLGRGDYEAAEKIMVQRGMLDKVPEGWKQTNSFNLKSVVRRYSLPKETITFSLAYAVDDVDKLDYSVDSGTVGVKDATKNPAFLTLNVYPFFDAPEVLTDDEEILKYQKNQCLEIHKPHMMFGFRMNVEAFEPMLGLGVGGRFKVWDIRFGVNLWGGIVYSRDENLKTGIAVGDSVTSNPVEKSDSFDGVWGVAISWP